ncbi:MAG TPA: hypothetical protein IAB63_04495 [Candidatus Onthocola gallistercoris]|uniref:Uncharacterized protein n=1 Tax=Candidatus Onthocola gallistercoris TaxID=2840876 RepID=A0A9D1KWL1_9FIRM|nr:hypothetical protein [Candidatus Onthocola gallistercoris]
MEVGRMIYSTFLLTCAAIMGFLAAGDSCHSDGKSSDGHAIDAGNEKKNRFPFLTKESRIGSDLSQGEIVIPQGVMEEATAHPEAVVVVFLDEMKEIIPYEKKDITYELAEDGWYGFFALDANKKMTEISGMALAQRG